MNSFWYRLILVSCTQPLKQPSFPELYLFLLLGLHVHAGVSKGRHVYSNFLTFRPILTFLHFVRCIKNDFIHTEV